jgi:hypothetical protein
VPSYSLVKKQGHRSLSRVSRFSTICPIHFFANRKIRCSRGQGLAENIVIVDTVQTTEKFLENGILPMHKDPI